jgi:XTP/dITP diphosphohydrolase
VIAEEHGDFTYQTVENAIVNKLVRRHPHVFGDVSVADSNEVVTNWQAIKAQERAGKPEKHPAERVPKALGALARATEVASALGMPKGSRQDVLHALETATDDAESVSNVLEAVMAWARGAGVHAEVVLRERTDRRVRETVQTVVARTETV